MVVTVERRDFLRSTSALIAAGTVFPLLSCGTGPIRSGRVFAYSAAGGASPAPGTDESSAIRTAYRDLGTLNSRLQPGDTVVFPDRRYRLSEPVSLVDGVTYRAAGDSDLRPILDAQGKLEYCIAGVGSQGVTLERLHCVNARSNGIDIQADAASGRLPANVTVRACESSANGRLDGARLAHEQGNGIAIHSGSRYQARLQSTTSGIVVEDCEAHENLHAGILIDLPGVGHRISRCRAGGNGSGPNTNAWAILIRPPGGVKLRGWTPARVDGVWTSVTPRFRHQLPVHVVCTRLRHGERQRWRNTVWDFAETRGDALTPGPGEYGFVPDARQPRLDVNPGGAKQFRMVIGWIGECLEPLIEDCVAWQQGGRDGVGIGFDQNTIGGTVRNCESFDNKRGFSLHINRGGALIDNIAYRNAEYGLRVDRNMGTVEVAGNTGYENGLSDFYFAVFDGRKPRLRLLRNKAFSETGFLGDDYEAAATGTADANSYCGSGKSSSGMPSVVMSRETGDCRR